MKINNYELYDEGRAKYLKHTENINDKFIRCTIKNNKIYSRKSITEGDTIQYGNNTYKCVNIQNYNNGLDGDFCRCEAELEEINVR